MKAKIFNSISPFLFATIIFLVFKTWFFSPVISGGDYVFVWKEVAESLTDSALSSWSSTINLGLPTISLLHGSPYIALINLTLKLGIDWYIVQKLFGLWSFLIISSLSSFLFTSKLFKNRILSLTSAFIYMTNTYILMIMGGGQVGLGLAYAVVPLVLGIFMSPIPNCKFQIPYNMKSALVAGLTLAVQAIFDLRITFMTIIAVGLYYLLKLDASAFANQNSKLLWKNLFLVLGIPIIIVAGFHAFWLFPMIAMGFSPEEVLSAFGKAYTSVEAVRFFSFADFPHAFSMLHPNWPENIFGKVYFLKPEFLLLPILTYASLVFLSSKFPARGGSVLYFALLGLIGTFLAKGANEPFGGFYIWLFENFPGFIMFRDPTKWYLLVTLSYSVLIPYTLGSIASALSSKLKAKSPKLQLKIQNLAILAFVTYWLFLIHPAWMGELSGTFQAHEIPQEYSELKDFIHGQAGFFRTFWIPQKQRFGFLSLNHPTMNATDMLKVNSAKEVVDWLVNDKAREQLARWSVKYLIIPYDSEGELFLEEREYSPRARIEAENETEKIEWLERIEEFEEISVFEMRGYKDRFWIEANKFPISTSKLQWQMESPTKYLVTIERIEGPFRLVFSERYDRGWEIRRCKRQKANLRTELRSKKCKTNPSTTTNDGLNSFEISSNFLSNDRDKIELEVFYKPQKYVNYGLIISLTTLFFITGLLSKTLLFSKKKYYHDSYRDSDTLGL